MDDRVIYIGMPRIENRGDKVRVVADILIDGETRSLWFEVSASYGQYLCWERSDGFLIGLLYTALNEHYDIECDAPVSEELLHNISTYLIPSVVKHGKNLHAPKITCAIESEPIKNAGGVGTGISCGVDSMHAIATNWKSMYTNLNLTHLILYNVGAFWKDGTQIAWQLSQARKFASEYGFKLIETDSNLHKAFPRDHLLANTYSNVFAVYLLQKLWKCYYFGSAGVDFESFTLKNNNLYDCAHYDLLSLSCYSTSTLQIYSDGGAKTRYEKMQMLIDFEPAQKYLDCCILVGEGSESGKPNCGKCGKCRRTLVNLDALGALDKFDQVFDIGYYKSHINEYYSWLLEQVWKPGGDDMISEAYEILYPRIPRKLKVENWIKKMCFLLRNYLQCTLKYNKSFYLFYRRFIRRYPNWQES